MLTIELPDMSATPYTGAGSSWTSTLDVLDAEGLRFPGGPLHWTGAGYTIRIRLESGYVLVIGDRETGTLNQHPTEHDSGWFVTVECVAHETGECEHCEAHGSHVSASRESSTYGALVECVREAMFHLTRRF